MKYILFILIYKNVIIINFIKFFFKHVEYCFNMSKNIIINKNSCIIFEF